MKGASLRPGQGYTGLLGEMDKEQKSIKRIQMASEMSLYHYGKPLVCTYSGGKDSEGISMRRFDRILQDERKKKGISQEKLAKMTGVTVRKISYWETGKRKMTLENADKVFKALNVSVVIGER